MQDVPNPPKLLWVECNSKDASVVWEPRGDNRAPILTYKIQYNTSFQPDTWETATGTHTHASRLGSVTMKTKCVCINQQFKVC